MNPNDDGDSDGRQHHRPADESSTTTSRRPNNAAASKATSRTRRDDAMHGPVLPRTTTSRRKQQRRQCELQKLTQQRDAKRLQLQSLFQQYKSIQGEMKQLEVVLMTLDEDIDRMEEELLVQPQEDDVSDDDEVDVEVQQYPSTKDGTMLDSSQMDDVRDASEQHQQSDPRSRHHRMLSATQPDEFLPDPSTQSPVFVRAPTMSHARLDTDDSRHSESTAGAVGPLHLVQVTTNTTRKNQGSASLQNRENQHNHSPGGGVAVTRPATLETFFQPRTKASSSAASSTNNNVPTTETASRVTTSNHHTVHENDVGVGSSTNVIDLVSPRYQTSNHYTNQDHHPPHQHSNQQPSQPYAQLPSRQAQTQQYHPPQPRPVMDVNARYRDDANFAWSSEIRRLLQTRFRLQSFRDHQKEIINATLSGDDVFVVMRTGGGKSLTYQLPALYEGRGPQRKVTFVVSPLLSLIQDQEDQMNQFAPGSAVSFTSNLVGGNAEHARRWSLVRDPDQGVCLVFITPEKISQSKKLQTEMEKLSHQGRLGRFVIDECHCASQWGHDFRPDYTKLGLLKRHFPYVPCMAVTATASDKVRDDVCEILCLGTNYRFFRSSANRPNLHYSIRPKRDGKEVVSDMVAFIKEKHPRHAGIVYTFSRKDADTLADQMCDLGVVARAYHSDVTPKNKEYIHSSWMRNETQVVVATIAFGLGINKPDVRFVLHHTISKTLDAYYQESGRAGRDGNNADCVLYYSPKDVPRMLKMVHGTKGEHLLWPMVRYAQASSSDAVCRAILMSHLGEPIFDDMEGLLRQYDGTYTENRQVGRHCQTVTRLLAELVQHGDKLTMPQLLKEWRSKASSAPKCVRDFPPSTDNLTVEECERIIISLLIESVFEPIIVWTAYDSIVYLGVGHRGMNLIRSPSPSVCIRFPKYDDKKVPAQELQKKTRKAITNEEGWMTAKSKASKRKKATAVASKAKPAKKKPRAKKAPRVAAKRKAKPPAKKVPPGEVIELSDDDDEEEDDNPVATSEPKGSRDPDDLWEDEVGSSEEEFEFED